MRIKNLQFAKHLSFIALLIGCLAVNSNSRSLVEMPDLSPLPLQVGEKLTYDIRWKKIRAAQRTDWIAKETTVNGQSVYHIQSEMKTRSLLGSTASNGRKRRI